MNIDSNNIPDCVLKVLILYYGLTIDLKNKIKNKTKEKEKYNLINYEWIEQVIINSLISKIILIH